MRRARRHAAHVRPWIRGGGRAGKYTSLTGKSPRTVQPRRAAAWGDRKLHGAAPTPSHNSAQHRDAGGAAREPAGPAEGPGAPSGAGARPVHPPPPHRCPGRLSHLSARPHTRRCWRCCPLSGGWAGPRPPPYPASASWERWASRPAAPHPGSPAGCAAGGGGKCKSPARWTQRRRLASRLAPARAPDEGAGPGAAPSLTFRASAGGEMSLSRWESRASPEAPPCSTPAEAPHTCTHSSSTAYTLVRTVLRGSEEQP